MANLTERRNKDGVLTGYKIRVFRGTASDGSKRFSTTTFKVQPTWTEKTARKRAEDFAAVYEDKVKEGKVADGRQPFEAYCEYVIGLRAERGKLKKSTAARYKELTRRIYPAIGHLKIRDIQVRHLNDLYSALGKDGVNKRGGRLSNKTILEHHRLIHSVLDQAMKEGLIPYNPADRVELPKVEKKEANHFQLDEIQAIVSALEEEPIKWRTLVHMLMVTGARRGEILGLVWDNVDLNNGEILIDRNVLYHPDHGIYIDTTKTETSKRSITLPEGTPELLRQYKAWQNEERLRLGAFYKYQGFVFSQDNGNPMHPDSVTDWLNKFSKRHSLPHINPHAFRHTMASILFLNGADPVSVSNRLGHAQVSTTANIYAHFMKEADKRNADILSNVFASSGR